MTLAAAAIAVGLFSWAASAHLERACVEMDTPYLPLCPPPPEQPAVIGQELRARLARNPGDSTAWTRLLLTERNGAALPGAVLAAPNNHNVARLRAAAALQAGKLPEGIAVLIELLRNRASPESARVIAQVAAAPQGMALLQPHLATAGEWLPQVLSASTALKQPAGTLLPLMYGAMERGPVPEGTRRLYMQMLKGQGQWLDAYGLWLAYHKDPVPLLYNPGFDQPMVPDGFDWEFTSLPRARAGLVIQQEALARRGHVLHIEFLGRAFTSPVVRQYVFAAPGAYRLRGEYMASRLRSELGLAWSVRCTGAGNALAGRSPELRDTGGAWRVFQFDITIPPDCGPVASLQLEPAAAYEAAAGIKGHVAFDAFSLGRPGLSQ